MVGASAGTFHGGAPLTHRAALEQLDPPQRPRRLHCAEAPAARGIETPPLELGLTTGPIRHHRRIHPREKLERRRQRIVGAALEGDQARPVALINAGKTV